jgi:hypothetical protein
MSNLDRTGIILYTIAYGACVAFYRDVLELEVMFSTEMLTCFSFGGAYLMVELDDTYDSSAEAEKNTRLKESRLTIRSTVGEPLLSSLILTEICALSKTVKNLKSRWKLD